MTSIFSYGSNSINQLRGRIGNPSLHAAPAYLYDWSRIFCYRAPRWGNGGVASLAPHDGARTLGSLVQLDDHELHILDGFERGYIRQEVDVFLPNTNEIQRSNVYIATDPTWYEPPSEEYLTAIHVMLREQHRDVGPIPINRLHSNGVVETLLDWHHPGPAKLSLPSLVVEVNARRRSPWTMPHVIEDIVKGLEELNIKTTEEFINFLRVDDCHAMIKQRRPEAESTTVHLDDEAVDLFKLLL